MGDAQGGHPDSARMEEEVKLSRLELLVAFLGALVDAPRFVEIGLGLYGSKWVEWENARGMIHGLTTGAFGLVLAAVIIIAAGELVRNWSPLLFGLLTGTIVTSTAATVSALVGAQGWFAVLCAALAPTLAVVVLPIAAHSRANTSPNAPKTRTTMRGAIEVQRTTESQPEAAPVRFEGMPEAAPQNTPQVAEQKQLTQGVSEPLALTDDSLRAWLTSNAGANSNDAARAFRVSAPRIRQMAAWQTRAAANA